MKQFLLLFTGSMSSAATKYGRKLHELDCGCRGCGGRAAWMRRKILHETLKKLDDENDRNKFRDMALGNVERWALAGGETTRQAAESTDDAGGGPAGTGAEKVVKTKVRACRECVLCVQCTLGTGLLIII